jgi:hypothetical protein
MKLMSARGRLDHIRHIAEQFFWRSPESEFKYTMPKMYVDRIKELATMPDLARKPKRRKRG